MTIPGRGGQQQRPFTAQGQQTPPGVQAGVNNQVVRARQVIVSGGAGEGVFIYQGTPKLGNPPVLALSGTNPSGTVDPFGNVIQSGAVAYTGADWVSLFAGALAFGNAGGQLCAILSNGSGGLELSATTVQLRGGAPATIPISSAGVTTVAQVVALLQQVGVFS